MPDLFPVSLTDLFLGEIKKQQREPDGLLHPSGDLIGSLRHSQLRAAGAPARSRAIAQDIRLMHGTIWHDWFHGVLERAGVRHENEVNVTEWMPQGWTGTADWVFYHPEYEAWVLGDLKTTKGESIWFKQTHGASEEHIWQASAYWHALVASGRPMLKGIGVLYWPMNDVPGKDNITPTLCEFDPIPEEVILPVMEYRWQRTLDYLNTVEVLASEEVVDYFLNAELEPVQDRVQKLVKNAGQECWDLKLVPHWSAAFCDFPTYCDCSEQGTTKIGSYDYETKEYTPRAGYEDIVPELTPGE